MGWKDIVSKIVETDDKPKEKAQTTARPVQAPASASNADGAGAPARASADTPLPTAAGEVSGAELERGIRAAVEEAPGFAAYVNFAEKLRKLGSVANERERYAAALSVADLPLDAVLSAVNSHKATLVEEKARFEETYVTPTLANIGVLKDKDAALQTEIDALNQQLAAKIAEREDTARQASDETARLAKQRIDFETASSNVARFYDGIVQTLQNNLGAPANGQ